MPTLATAAPPGNAAPDNLDALLDLACTVYRDATSQEPDRPGMSAALAVILPAVAASTMQQAADVLPGHLHEWLHTCAESLRNPS